MFRSVFVLLALYVVASHALSKDLAVQPAITVATNFGGLSVILNSIIPDVLKKLEGKAVLLC